MDTWGSSGTPNVKGWVFGSCSFWWIKKKSTFLSLEEDINFWLITFDTSKVGLKIIFFRSINNEGMHIRRILIWDVFLFVLMFLVEFDQINKKHKHSNRAAERGMRSADALTQELKHIFKMFMVRTFHMWMFYCCFQVIKRRRLTFSWTLSFTTCFVCLSLAVGAQTDAFSQELLRSSAAAALSLLASHFAARAWSADASRGSLSAKWSCLSLCREDCSLWATRRFWTGAASRLWWTRVLGVCCSRAEIPRCSVSLLLHHHLASSLRLLSPPMLPVSVRMDAKRIRVGVFGSFPRILTRIRRFCRTVVKESSWRRAKGCPSDFRGVSAAWTRLLSLQNQSAQKRYHVRLRWGFWLLLVICLFVFRAWSQLRAGLGFGSAEPSMSDFVGRSDCVPGPSVLQLLQHSSSFSCQNCLESGASTWQTNKGPPADAAEGPIHMQISIDFHSARQSRKPASGSQHLSIFLLLLLLFIQICLNWSTWTKSCWSRSTPPPPPSSWKQSNTTRTNPP